MSNDYRLLKYVVAFVFSLPLSVSVLAQPPENFDARMEVVRQKAGVPGMAIAIVEQGEATLVKGYGTRKLGGTKPVDEATIFPTGSTGKAVTVAGLALLVDQGKIGWDDKVIDHLPWFRMYDPYVTREMTVRDLLVHRSGLGLGAGDLLFVPRTNLTRKESVRRLAHIKPATSFRYGYAYDNILYMVAGQLIEEVTGQTWEEYTAEHIFAKAGMRDSTAASEPRFSADNRAFPHARLDGGLRGAGNQEMLDERDELGRTAAPAGGLAVSARDMATWLKIQLAHGKMPNGDRLFSEQASKEMWTPVVLMPIRDPAPELAATKPNFSTYALGWDVSDYRGVKIISHGGAVFGFQTIVAMIPGQDVGFAIMINSEDGQVLLGMMYELLDHYLGAPKADWPEKWSALRRDRVEKGLAMLQSAQAKPAKVGPSLALDAYVGEYVDPWYGKIIVGRDKQGLTIDFTSTPRMNGRLEHHQYDSFVTRLTDKTIEPAAVTFSLDADGAVERVTMKAVSPIADFSYDYHDLLFEPVAADK
ncbi:serine hydrolase [Parasphingorhabdus sp.]|uniref:serine hydrolase n=1 Tax=Parasphingorhabdus sp. TaxID=2709688 RepID=UPI0030018704